MQTASSLEILKFNLCENLFMKVTITVTSTSFTQFLTNNSFIQFAQFYSIRFLNICRKKARKKFKRFGNFNF